MSQYGIPYMGSKAKICEEVCRVFPKATHFYDVFGGGFSITHYMLQHRGHDYKTFHFNEIRPGVTQLIQDAIAGKYNYDRFKPEWISREMFNALKDQDAYVKLIWSFGNDGKTYLFGKDIEPKKKSLHQAIVFNEFDSFAKEILGLDRFKDGYSVTDKRLYLANRVRVLKTKRLDLQQLQQLQQLQRLQQLERLQRLQQLERLTFSQLDYREIKIEHDSVVYCDPPYAGTKDYGREFNTKAFLDWADGLGAPVFISEYNITDERFKLIASIRKMQRLSSTGRAIKQERIYANRLGYDLWFSQHHLKR